MSTQSPRAASSCPRRTRSSSSSVRDTAPSATRSSSRLRLEALGLLGHGLDLGAQALRGRTERVGLVGVELGQQGVELGALGRRDLTTGLLLSKRLEACGLVVGPPHELRAWQRAGMMPT